MTDKPKTYFVFFTVCVLIFVMMMTYQKILYIEEMIPTVACSK